MMAVSISVERVGNESQTPKCSVGRYFVAAGFFGFGGA